MSVTPAPSPPAAALPPTLAQIKQWSRVDFSGLEDPYTDEDLQVRLTRAVADLAAITGRPFDDTMPPFLVPIAQEAVQLLVEQMCFQEQSDYSETVNDDMIQSFTAGNYSETRTMERGRHTGMTTGLPQINPNAWLNRDIWLLCTPAMQDYWSMSINGVSAFANVPYQEVTEADWGNYGGLYPDDWRLSYEWGSAVWGVP